MKNIITTLVLLLAISTAYGQNKDTVRIKTSSICEMCKRTIEGDLAFEKGVTYSNLDLETHVVTVVYKPKSTNPDLIRKRLTEIGYDADSLKAIPEAVEKLPECCKPNNPFHKKKED
jgi:mercuric ion binding protein